MTDTPVLHPPSADEVRAELEAMVRADLLGPSGGDEEEVTDRITERYIVGALAPRGTEVEPGAHDRVAEEAPTSSDEYSDDNEPPGQATFFPSSLGLSFVVDGTETEIVVEASWGRYHRRDSAVLRPDGTPRKVWQREPVVATRRVALEDGTVEERDLTDAQPDVVLRGRVRRHDDQWVVSLFLVNGQHRPKTLVGAAWIFQSGLQVRRATEDAAPFRRRRVLVPNSAESDAAEIRALAMRYRSVPEFAVGHGIGVHAEIDLRDPTRAVTLCTVSMPAYDVPRTDAADVRDAPELAALELDMRSLADADSEDLPRLLQPLVTAYDGWLADRQAAVRDLAAGLADFPDEAARALEEGRVARDRIQVGIDLLSRDPQAAMAFRFANEAMWHQRVRGEAARQRRRDPGRPLPEVLAEVDVPANRSWRPFQLAFLLLGIPALSDPLHPDRGAEQGLVDLLWFPTGGGKTEAYLGLTAYTLAIRRLLPDLGGCDARDGVAVLMRYTLRLLTVQQFQRAATLLCACEVIRRRDPRTWGSTPFRIGLWVGGRVTPNHTDAADEWVKQQRGKRGPQQGGAGSPYQLTSCPWCGTALQPQRDVAVDMTRRRTIMACPETTGQCPFTLRGSPGEGLPVVVVDEEVYRLLPALVIATVDKFAQMPWKGEVATLFGRVTGRCERHGFRSPDLDWEADTHPARGNHPPAKTVPAGPLRPPDLIVQDELHLISGPLGSLVGLYESAVDHLASWQIDGRTVRPKVVASTATVRGAQRQVGGLFVRGVAVFPPPGLDAADSFFARQRPLSAAPGRRYVGVCAHGRRFKAVLIRIYVATLLAAQTLHDRYGGHEVTDPYMTLVGYFGSLRELGGMRRLVDDDVSTRIGKGEELGLSRRPRPIVEELTSRLSSSQIPEVLDRLELAVGAGRPKDQGWPIDVLLATNMISVGVDVQRLGLMVVAGQPKSAAEYIQATSRVGRRAPGLVFTVFNWARPRDLSHYETFEHFHATYYRHVEALSVTPFADRALDRGLTPLLVSLVRLAGEDWNANRAAQQIDRHSTEIKELAAVIVSRAMRVSPERSVAADLQKRLDHLLDQWAAKAHVGNRRLGYQGSADGLTAPLLQRPAKGAWTDWTCLTSLRDVEPGIRLLLADGRGEAHDEPPFEPPAHLSASMEESASVDSDGGEQ